MANREELLVIRAARAGQATAQLALGKRYLFGGAGLPKSETTALYWLDRAAHQQQDEAWILIGSHIPFEAAVRAAQPDALCIWYERAFDSGVLQAGLVLAKLVLAQTPAGPTEALRRKAWMALESVAHAGVGEAQWLMAQLIGQLNAGTKNASTSAVSHAFVSPLMQLPSSGRAEQAALDWTIRAADGGVTLAQRALAEHAWKAGNEQIFLHWAVPLGRKIVAHRLSRQPSDELDGDIATQTSLLARCAKLLMQREDTDRSELEQFLEAAANDGDRESCLALGLWYARMDGDGHRLPGARGLANYKRALRWLTVAGEKGAADAWFAISRIYIKPEFSQRNLSDAHHFASKAAEGGNAAAQYELGSVAWRSRRADAEKDVEAVYWLRKAAAQDHAESIDLLQKIADTPASADWAVDALQNMSRNEINAYPLLTARLELAAEFGLSRAEALLLDMSVADHGHCLVADIRSVHPRSRRRLVLIQTNEQRHVLTRIVRQFEDTNCTVHGPEGNYRQRLYRLRMLLRR